MGEARATRISRCRKALAEWLAREYKVKATVVYDRPGAAFTRPSAAEATELWETDREGNQARRHASADRGLSDQLDAG